MTCMATAEYKYIIIVYVPFNGKGMEQEQNLLLCT